MIANGVLEPFNSADVEMISRLVEQQQLGIGHQSLSERRTSSPAARQIAHAPTNRQAELADDGANANSDIPTAAGLDVALEAFDCPQGVWIVACGRSQPLEFRDSTELAAHTARHEVVDELERLVGQLLLQQAPAQASRHLDSAVVGFLRARNQPQSRGLAGAVAAYETDALTGLYGELGIDEHSLVAERHRNAVKAHQGGHSKGSYDWGGVL